MIQKALQVAGNQDIHRRADGLEEVTVPVINAGGEEIRQHVVGVGSTDQLLYRQSHAQGIITSQDITKIACRHGKTDFIPGTDNACL